MITNFNQKSFLFSFRTCVTPDLETRMITILIKVKHKLSAQPDSPKAFVEPSRTLDQSTYGGTAIERNFRPD